MTNPRPDCSCERCHEAFLEDCVMCRKNAFWRAHMIVCVDCGNKRCPHATDHDNACTGSNEPGQPGSSYR